MEEKEKVIPSILYDINEPTENPVTASLTFIQGEGVIQGNNSHTFMKNGSYEFQYLDENNELQSIKAEVKWIIPCDWCDNKNISIIPCDMKKKIIDYSICAAKEIYGNKCTIPNSFINFILALKAYEIALMSEDNLIIESFQNKLKGIIEILNINTSSRNCNCK